MFNDGCLMMDGLIFNEKMLPVTARAAPQFTSN